MKMIDVFVMNKTHYRDKSKPVTKQSCNDEMEINDAFMMNEPCYRDF